MISWSIHHISWACQHIQSISLAFLKRVQIVTGLASPEHILHASRAYSEHTQRAYLEHIQGVPSASNCNNLRAYTLSWHISTSYWMSCELIEPTLLTAQGKTLQHWHQKGRCSVGQPYLRLAHVSSLERVDWRFDFLLMATYTLPELHIEHTVYYGVHVGWDGHRDINT